MPRYIIEEVATYEVEAKNRAQAEKIFLDSISVQKPVYCVEVSEREIYRAKEVQS